MKYDKAMEWHISYCYFQMKNEFVHQEIFVLEQMMLELKCIRKEYYEKNLLYFATLSEM